MNQSFQNYLISYANIDEILCEMYKEPAIRRSNQMIHQ